MKTHICLILLALMATLTLTGCQQAIAQTDELPAVAAEEKPQKKPAKQAPKNNEYKVVWEEKCSVKDAFLSSAWILEDLGLIPTRSSGRTQTVRVRDPRTGRMTTKQVPVSDKYGRSDGLSAYLTAHSTAGIEFQTIILFVPTETCQITINASSLIQPKDILKQQSNYLKQQISKAILNPVSEAETEETAQSLPYPETMVFDRTVKEVSSAIYNWSSKERFRHNGRGGEDKYYKEASVSCESGIEFSFYMRLIDENKTNLTIRVGGYDNKDEFDLILKGLMKTLEALKTDQPASKTATCIETKTIDHPITAVNDTLISWAKGNNFSIGRSTGGDAFYKFFSFRTAAGIAFDFQMHLIGTNETKLSMTVTDQEGREEFPMILKSFEEALGGIGNKQAESAAQAEETGKPEKPVPSKKPRQEGQE